MNDLQFLSVAKDAGWLLVSSVVVQLPGLLMFMFRDGQHGGAPRSPLHYAWERGFIMAAAVLAPIGFVLLGVALQDSGGQAPAITGAIACVMGGVMVVAGEALSLEWGYDKVYRLIVASVIVTFLAQAAIGGAVLQGGLVAAWIGWVTIGWNLGMMVILMIFSRRDIYFPVVHSVAPLLIGIALLLK
jgi:hypothetical protein